MKLIRKFAVAAAVAVLAGQAFAQATFYSREEMRGEAVTLDRHSGNFERYDFNDRASSVVIEGGLWEVCEHVRFEGRCVVLRRGAYPSLREIGLNNAISSARPLERERAHGHRQVETVRAPQYGPYDPAPAQPVPYGHGPARVIYEVPVTSAQAVLGPPQQRCWVEKEQVAVQRREPNVGGAILGGVIGGVLGNQVGKGSGNDIATVGGAIAGAAIGAHVGRDRSPAVAERDVQRCRAVQNGQVAYWDVTYVHGGVERRVQLANQPGPTIRVNGHGQPML